MKQKFTAKKDKFWIYIFISLLFPIYIYSLDEIDVNLMYYLIPAFLPFIIFIWAYFSTVYYIDSQYFYYKSAFLKGRIEIEKIKEIEQNKTLWSGVKPALAAKGLIIKYGYDEIYVAPLSNEQLTQALLKINTNIIVK